MLHIAVLLPLVGLLAAVVALVAWAQHVTTFWKRHRMPYVPALPLIGNFKDIATFKTAVGERLQEIYNDAAAIGQPAVGFHMFYKPALMVRDPELLRRVLAKDFGSFCERYSHADHHTDPLGGRNLFFLHYAQWRTLRAKLTPFFTVAKLRQMFNLMKDVGAASDRVLCELTATDSRSALVEVRERMARFTIDVVASCAFGIIANSVVNPESEFRQCGRQMFEFTYGRAMEFTSIFFLPELVSVFGFKLFTETSGQFLRQSISYVIGEREKSGLKRNDLIDTLIELKNEDRPMIDEDEGKRSQDDDELVFEGDVLVAQASIFFAAGFETSSSSMTFSLYELAKHPEIQTRLREEIRETLHANGGEFTFDAINSMEYLNMVFLETIRLYPILPFVDRKCTADEGYSLEPFASFIVPKGMPIIVPSYALHRDPQHFPDPDRFDPERFSASNRARIPPFTYMPFGLGPHNCIGERFAIVQSKLGLASFLRNHRVRPSERTPCIGRMVYGKTSLMLQPMEDLYLTVERDPLI